MTTRRVRVSSCVYQHERKLADLIFSFCDNAVCAKTTAASSTTRRSRRCGCGQSTRSSPGCTRRMSQCRWAWAGARSTGGWPSTARAGRTRCGPVRCRADRAVHRHGAGPPGHRRRSGHRSASGRVVVAGSPGGISPPGSHRTERDSLPSFRSSHPSFRSWASMPSGRRDSALFVEAHATTAGLS